jgi:hypothetical protein
VNGYYRAYVDARNNYAAGDPYSKTTLTQTLSVCQGKTYTISADVTFEYVVLLSVGILSSSLYTETFPL